MSLLPLKPLVQHQRVTFGQFEDSLSEINVADYRYESPFGRAYSPLSRWLHFKQFQYFGAMSERFVFGCALVNIRYAATVFLYVYDFKTGELFSRSYKTPLGMALNLSSNPVQGSSEFSLPGVSVVMGYQGSPRQKSLLVNIKDELLIEAQMPEVDFEPMSICTRAAYQGWVYANKTAGLVLNGRICFKGETFDLKNLKALGHHDFSCGFMRRETYWNWACLSGEAQGHRIGLNISCGVNETSFTENCLWVDGKLIKVNLARFNFDQSDVLKPWHISSDDGLVDLHFEPLGAHRERLQLGVVASNFKQVFGYFSGVLRLGTGDINIVRMPGFVEDQYAKW